MEIVLRARQTYLDALPIAAAVVVQDDLGRLRVVAANAAFDRIEALTGKPGKLLHRAPFDNAFADFLDGDQAAIQFNWTTDSTASARHFIVRLATLEPLPGMPWRCMVSLVDRTAEVESERSLRAEMLHDSLTGLPNRVAFDEALEEAAACDRAGGATSHHAVLVVDLARFSRVNECMGSMAGDELIITVARRLLFTLRAGDVLARIGGDEFGILMRINASVEEAREAARRIVTTLSTPFRLSDLEIRIDCAVGCAMTREGAGFAEDVVRNAQFACKRAKSTGSVEIYQSGEATAVRRRFSIETELRRALENARLELAYQPLVDLASNRVTGFEALARWSHPEEGMISPAEFIPVAEESGLIVPLGRWAMETAVRQLAEWDEAAGSALPLSMAVNLSAIQLTRDDVPTMVAETLARHGVAGRRLVVELTESAIVHDPERAARVLGQLKALDCAIAMDDFGTGHSNLAYLQKLPIDVLKIDRSFITGMLTDRDKVAIVRAVLGLANALGMRTTAEGIEAVELAHTLSALGCSHGQGYYFGRPMSADEAMACFRAFNG
ncbi:bifunctional diguanylate cyclase/phosphodiesterase [Sphingomonas sp. XMGL2]|uniref:Bifunctional diguanylate cyclase/phosphodiesterase n=2 Tax=Sphingomonas quercus TaxID=2842451 RepID=A0ABS6BH35_9SPHN|nr:bifunctional diguanylate cyclase/phosphodiesterase [Sphingomonas quercus]MBU3077112.1 bifunctional diguanylate cyclase/phosphodiesterase [Sphingomonas quercus]